MGQENQQERIEQTLKEIHVLFSQCETYNEDKNMIIVDKRKLFRLLEQVNLNMYEMMDAFEVTEQAHARAERKSREKCDRIIEDANQKAEEIYSAAMMYTDEALGMLNDKMAAMMDDISQMYGEVQKEVRKQNNRIKENRKDLRDQLEDLKDGEKYLKLIEKENSGKTKTIEEEYEPEDEERRAYRKTYIREPESYGEVIKVSAPKPVIKVDPLYEDTTFSTGIEEDEVIPSEPRINVNYNSEYFRQREAELPDVDEGVVEDE